jgi:hypothetical protein
MTVLWLYFYTMQEFNLKTSILFIDYMKA